MKSGKSILSALVTLSLTVSCQPGGNLSIVSTSDNQKITGYQIGIPNTSITGTARFTNPLISNFSLKANLADIGTNATVSLIYPPDHPVSPNKTIATGLTDSTGKFTINPGNSVNFETNIAYVLEAAKRIGNTGNDTLSIRTFIQWNGDSWDSITTPGILINTHTTAVTVISALDTSSATPLQTIKKLDVFNGSTQASDITSGLTASTINIVEEMITKLLSKNRDPVNYIKYNSGVFSIDNPMEIGRPGTIVTIAGNGTAGFSGDGGQATNASLDNPRGIATDNNGNIFIIENNRIRKVDSNGIITTIAGNGTVGFSGDGGKALYASLNSSNIASDNNGNIYIADSSNRIRKVDSNGIITTVAGNGTAGFSGDTGQAINASLNRPNGIATDNNGNIYIAEGFNHRIRRVDSNGIITTVAGNGTTGFSGDGGQATNASLNNPNGISIDNNGNIFIADWSNRIRKVASNGIITTIAGSGAGGFSGDNGQAINASLKIQNMIVNIIKTDNNGNIFISDSFNHRIRKVDSNGIITTIAGNGTEGFSGDGGRSVNSSIAIPTGITIGKNGNILITDYGNHRIRKIYSGY